MHASLRLQHSSCRTSSCSSQLGQQPSHPASIGSPAPPVATTHCSALKGRRIRVSVRASHKHELWLEHDSDGHHVAHQAPGQHPQGPSVHSPHQPAFLHPDNSSHLEGGSLWAMLRQTMPSGPAPLWKATLPTPGAVTAFTLLERKPLAGGWLELVRWEDAPSERLMRVWLPPGYYQCADGSAPVQAPPVTTPAATTTTTASSAPKEPAGPVVRTTPDEDLVTTEPPAGGWPVFFLNDAQNLFEDRLSFSGCSWKAADVAADLIKAGSVPPFVIVGLDHANSLRSYEYTPYRPGTAPGGYRQDAAAWPGGGVHDYLTRIVYEVVPWSQAAYQLSRHPDRMGFGGSSFGGICTICMSMRFPELFGSALIESPSLWIAEEQFLRQDITQYSGGWPRRIFIAMGGSEYKNDGSQVFSKMLVGYLHTLRDLIQEKCAARGVLLGWEVVPEAGHNERAWQERLPKALTHLCAHWGPLR